MKRVIIKLILRYVAGLICVYSSVEGTIHIFTKSEGVLAGSIMAMVLIYKVLIHETGGKASAKFKVVHVLYWASILLSGINNHFIDSKILTHIIEGTLSLFLVIMAELLFDCLLEP